jgi:hypothetical protein
MGSSDFGSPSGRCPIWRATDLAGFVDRREAIGVLSPPIQTEPHLGITSG